MAKEPVTENVDVVPDTLETLSAKYSSLYAEFSSLENVVNSLDKTVADLETKVDGVINTPVAAHDEIDDLKSDLDMLITRFEYIKNKYFRNDEPSDDVS
jgi:septation ring formation regulator EzrA